MAYYLAIFKITESYDKLPTKEKAAVIKKEWIYGQELAVKGIRIGGYFDHPAGVVYGFYKADSRQELDPLLDHYPTDLKHFSIHSVREVLMTQDCALSFRNPIGLLFGYLELWGFKLFQNSGFINRYLDKRVSSSSTPPTHEPAPPPHDS